MKKILQFFKSLFKKLKIKKKEKLKSSKDDIYPLY